MKKFVRCLLIVLILPIALMCSGCAINEDSAVSIKDIKKTDSVGVVDTYTITYTNGKTSQFSIVNGEDGENLYSNITINDLFNQVKGSKPEGYDLIDFIDEYLDVQIDSSAIASSKALRSAVSIYVEHEVDIVDYNNVISYTNTPYGPQANYGVKQSIVWGSGAGVIYQLDKQAGDAYIITNYHVCFSNDVKASDGIATRFITYLYGGESIDLADLKYLSYYNSNCKDYEYLFDNYDAKGIPEINYGYGAIEAEYVGGSELYDIAVLKVTNSDVIKNSDSIGAEVYDSDLVTAGSSAIAVGNPDAEGISVTNGVVSVDNEYISVQISDKAVTLREFRIDTPVNKGNSGGGLFDGFGRLVGIVNAKTKDTSAENMSYAIPSNIVTRIADSILDNCDGINRKTNRILLGITLNTINSKAHYDETSGLMRIKETVSISNIEGASLGNDIGLKTGDVISSIEIINANGTTVIEIDRVFKVVDAMLLAREGDCIKINYVRNLVAGSVATNTLTAENFISVK